MSRTIEFSLQNVEIIRGKDVITVDVPAHEVEVLKAIHGLERVSVVGQSEDTVSLSANADNEIDRLRRKYRRVNAPDAVDIAFRNGAKDFLAIGFKPGSGIAHNEPQASVKKHRPAPPVEEAADEKTASKK